MSLTSQTSSPKLLSSLLFCFLLEYSKNIHEVYKFPVRCNAKESQHQSRTDRKVPCCFSAPCTRGSLPLPPNSRIKQAYNHDIELPPYLPTPITPTYQRRRLLVSSLSLYGLMKKRTKAVEHALGIERGQDHYSQTTGDLDRD